MYQSVKILDLIKFYLNWQGKLITKYYLKFFLAFLDLINYVTLYLFLVKKGIYGTGF